MARQKPTASRRWQKAFLLALAREGNVSESCRKAKVNRPYVYEVREQDRAFAAAWDESLQEAVDALELAAFRRAKRKSDRLLAFLLQAHRPQVYGRRLEVTATATLELVEEIVDGGAQNPSPDGPATPPAGGVPPE